ncbi:hypothetical protein Vretifemale_12554, partial [Volvox reticuliferus]
MHGGDQLNAAPLQQSRESLDLDATISFELLLCSLEAAVTKLRGSVDELKLNLLQGIAAGLGQQRATQRNWPLLGAWDGALDHNVILTDDAIVCESAHGSDVLLGNIKLRGGSVRGLALLADLVYLLVDLGAVVEALLTGAGDSPLDTGRVPCANASHLAQATMGLARQARHTPALHHTLDTVTLGDSNRVDHLIGLEHSVNGYLLLEHAVCKVNLL